MPLLPTDPKKQRLLIIGAAPLLAAVAYWYFFQQDQTKQLDADRAHLEQLQTKNAAAKALAARSGPDLKKKLGLYEAHIARLEQLIPKSEEVPDLLHDITMRAEESGVELNLMRPEKATSNDFYTRQAYAMSVLGPYDGVGRFMAAVGSLTRIVVPLKLKIVPRVDRDRAGIQRLQADFQIQTYVAPEGGPKAAPAGPAKGGPNARK